MIGDLGRATRRMWRLYLPLTVLLLVLSLATASIPNGVSALAALVAGALVIVALVDWVGAELAAGRSH